MSSIGNIAGRGLALLVSVMMTCTSAQAQLPKSLADLTPLERRQTDFHGAIAEPGQVIRVHWTIETGRRGQSCQLTLHVVGTRNPEELKHPELASRPEFAELFTEIIPEPRRLDSASTALPYRVQPRNSGQWTVPMLKYLFCVPGLPEGRRFQTTFADPIPWTVREAEEATGEQLKVPLLVPELYLVPPDFDRLQQGSSEPTTTAWAILLGGAITGPMITYLVISRRYPDAARRQRLNRNAAARRAFARLDSANRAPDPLLELQRLLIAYLHQRHGLSETVSTADEVKSDLKTRGASVTVQRQQEIVEILEACDQQRFAASPQTPAVLAKLFTRVRVLIEAWEGESPS